MGSEVFLFGAGAVIDWGGPTTEELTTLVRESGFPLIDSEIKITEFIYQRLIEEGYESVEVNFETIINVIEELIVFYSEHNRKSQTPSLVRAFLRSNDLDKILNFSIRGGVRKHGYELEIPIGKTYNFARSAYNDENPKQFYLQHLLALLITNINARISKYSYHTAGNSVINTKSTNSKYFKNWISNISQQNIIRLYSINYDRLFKILLKEQEIECFEGFDVRENNEENFYLRANVSRIINDSESHIFYNLHGSSFWKVLPLDKRQLPNPEIVFKGAPDLPLNSGQANVQMEKGKPVFVTNIITGYQKAQKSMITPFKQMHASFDRDCCNANKIYIIGYSFGDEHLNECLRTAFRHNENLKVEIVSPNFIKKDMDRMLNLTLFQFIENKFLQPKKVDDNKFSYYDGKIVVYTLRFNEYLKMRAGH